MSFFEIGTPAARERVPPPSGPAGRLGVTSLVDQHEQILVDAIASARAERRTIPATTPAPSLGLAYRVQAMLHGDRTRRGWKVGHGESREARSVRDERAGLRADLREHAPRRQRVARPVHPTSVEPELAVVLADDIPAGANAGEAARAVPGVFLGLDILDTVWSDYRLEPAHAVADGVNGGGFLLADWLLPTDDDGYLSLYLDGERVTEGPVAALGDPVERCTWLAGRVGGLKAGEIVFLGSPAANVPARPGVLEVHGPGGAVMFGNLTR